MNPSPETDAPDRAEWSEEKTVHNPVLPAQEARQGATGQNVRYVLGFGMAAIVLAFLVIYLVYFV